MLIGAVIGKVIYEIRAVFHPTRDFIQQFSQLGITPKSGQASDGGPLFPFGVEVEEGQGRLPGQGLRFIGKIRILTQLWMSSQSGIQGPAGASIPRLFPIHFSRVAWAN